MLPPGGMIFRGYLCNLNHKINPETSLNPFPAADGDLLSASNFSG